MRLRHELPGRRAISLLEPLPPPASSPYRASSEGRHRRARRYHGGHQSDHFYYALALVIMWPAIALMTITIMLASAVAIIGVPLGWGW
jgi:hypothetical protein